MSWGNITDLPVLKYAAIQQATFAANMRENGKEPKTTFYGDLSIAEFYGPKDVQETFQRVKTDWGGTFGRVGRVQFPKILHYGNKNNYSQTIGKQ